MTRYRISEEASGISIELSEARGQQDELLAAFAECQSGHSSCPTDQYDKVASMEVRPDDERVELRLEAKPGTRLDAAQIATCLDHTIASVDTAGPSNRSARTT
jgi:hypothetical protein